MTKRIGFGWPSPTHHDRRDKGWGRQLALFEMIAARPPEERVVVVGWLVLDRHDLLRIKDRGLRTKVRVVGRLRLADDISPALADEVLDEVRVVGSLGVTPAVRERLGDRLHLGR